MTKSKTALPFSEEEFGQSIYDALFPHDNGVVNEDLLRNGYTPRPTQVGTIENAAYALMGMEDRKSGGSGLFRLPPRTGKTVSFGALSKIASDQGVNSVIIVPSMGLVGQTYEKLTEVCGLNPDTNEIGMYHGDVNQADREKALDANVLITTYDSFLNLVQSGDITPQNRPFLALDEAHHAMGDTRKGIFKDFMQQGALVHAWTATDMKADGDHVSAELFDNDPPIISKTIPETVRDGETTPIRNIVFQTGLESGVHSKPEAFSDSDAEKVVEQAGRNEAAVHKIMNSIDVVEYEGQKKDVHFATLPQIWYTAGRDNAKALAEELNTQYDSVRNDLPNGHDDGLETYAVAMDGDTPLKERERIFKDYADGKIRTLVSADLLIEGYDFPNCELTVMLRPTRSPRIALQAGARSCALDPNNPAKVGYVASFIDRDSRDVAIFGHYAGGGWIAPEKSPLQSVGYKTMEPNGAPKEGAHTELPDVDVYYDQIEEIEFSGQQEKAATKPAKLEKEPQPIRVSDGWENITSDKRGLRNTLQKYVKASRAHLRDVIAGNPKARAGFERMLAHEPGGATQLKEAIAGDQQAQAAWDEFVKQTRAQRRFEEIYRSFEDELKEALTNAGDINDPDVRSKTFVTVKVMNRDYDVAAPRITQGDETELYVRPKRHWNGEYIGTTKDQLDASSFKSTILRTIHAHRPYEFSSVKSQYITQNNSRFALIDQHRIPNEQADNMLQEAINEYENHQFTIKPYKDKDSAPFTASNGISVILAKQNGRVPSYHFSDSSLAAAAAKAPALKNNTPSTVISDYSAMGRIAKHGVTIEHNNGSHHAVRLAFVTPEQRDGVQAELKNEGINVDVGAVFSLKDKHLAGTMEKLTALANALENFHAKASQRSTA